MEESKQENLTEEIKPTEEYVFMNRKYTKYFKYDDVQVILKKYYAEGRKRKFVNVVGDFKAQIFKELLTKNRLRTNTLFHTQSNVYQLEEFSLTNWENGQYLPNERLVLTISHNKYETEKYRRKLERERALTEENQHESE